MIAPRAADTRRHSPRVDRVAPVRGDFEAAVRIGELLIAAGSSLDLLPSDLDVLRWAHHRPARHRLLACTSITEEFWGATRERLAPDQLAAPLSVVEVPPPLEASTAKPRIAST